MLFEKIRSIYGEKLQKTSQFSKVDYMDDNTLIEMKSRRNKHNTYPTTMISKSKIDYMLNSGKKSIALFNFTDGLYSIEINREKINHFDLGIGQRRDRGMHEQTKCFHIPIDMLTKI
jgi:hypothetical protein